MELQYSSMIIVRGILKDLKQVMIIILVIITEEK